MNVAAAVIPVAVTVASGHPRRPDAASGAGTPVRRRREPGEGRTPPVRHQPARRTVPGAS